MKKIKVLHVIEALGGGVYSYFTDLSSSFGNDASFETIISYSDKRKEIIPEKIASDFHKNMKLVRLPMKKEISPIFDLLAIIKLIRLISHTKPQVVHLHSSKAGVIGRIAHFLSGSKSKLFYTPHGYSFLRQDISKTKRNIYKFIEVSMSQLFGGNTIACGDTELIFAKEIDNAKLIRNGINISDIRSHKYKVINTKLTIGILGRITFARNPKMFNEIALRYPNINFIWIGDGELRHILNAQNIEITGWFNERTEGLNHLNKLDIYIQTSLWEGLPISILEAMALEKPVLATNVIGNKDIVVHGVTGYLFNTIEQLDGYLDYLKDENKRNKLGLMGYDRIKKLFDCHKNFEDLKKIYNSNLFQ
jgi:glycosyltransferase involved in cell wall biosynthesis